MRAGDLDITEVNDAEIYSHDGAGNSIKHSCRRRNPTRQMLVHFSSGSMEYTTKEHSEQSERV